MLLLLYILEGRCQKTTLLGEVLGSGGSKLLSDVVLLLLLLCEQVPV